MKKILFAKIMIIICIAGLILCTFNAFTGGINPKMTGGATTICIAGLMVAIINMVLLLKKNEK
ncbi:hypothetical protein [Acetobacterium tundrae]|uniref:Uncharacterized protein n=1 Tax=Acetobacterium tundrae TaxID=132932 RepID=A0ABR6WNX9_9FIRM|nr:hypothetical protein [Acetobacterium tundrae]MBC3798213.1 hypothetical protein [Acetobacterium tundrae]